MCSIFELNSVFFLLRIKNIKENFFTNSNIRKKHLKMLILQVIGVGFLIALFGGHCNGEPLAKANFYANLDQSYKDIASKETQSQQSESKNIIL